MAAVAAVRAVVVGIGAGSVAHRISGRARRRDALAVRARLDTRAHRRAIAAMDRIARDVDADVAVVDGVGALRQSRRANARAVRAAAAYAEHAATAAVIHVSECALAVAERKCVVGDRDGLWLATRLLPKHVGCTDAVGQGVSGQRRRSVGIDPNALHVEVMQDGVPLWIQSAQLDCEEIVVEVE